MDRPWSSEYGNPLTFNVAITFLFYVLSISLCLSSFTTCVCVIFNPLGTFRTIARYFFYALSLSVLSTFLFVCLTGVCFDNQPPPESQETHRTCDETVITAEHLEVQASQEAVDVAPIPEPHHEEPAPEEIVDAPLVQEPQHEEPASQEAVNAALVQEPHHEEPAPQEIVEATPIQDEHQEEIVEAMLTLKTQCEVSAPQEVEEATATLEAFRKVSAPQHFVEATVIRSAPTPLLAMIDIAKAADGALPFCEEITASPEMISYAAERNGNAPEAIAASHTETAGQDKATGESKKIENWTNQPTSAVIHKDSCGMLKGDDADIEGTAGNVAWSHNDSRPRCLSETRSVSQDSAFQMALRMYMEKGRRYAGREKKSSIPTPSEESEFQGSVRKMYKLEKVGAEIARGKRKALSV